MVLFGKLDLGVINIPFCRTDDRLLQAVHIWSIDPYPRQITALYEPKSTPSKKVKRNQGILPS